jgi:hypothetical protein
LKKEVSFDDRGLVTNPGYVSSTFSRIFRHLSVPQNCRHENTLKGKGLAGGQAATPS